MSERKYSVSEIDRMRTALENSYPSGIPYYSEERTAEIEAHLRTYMLNGTEPEELEERMWNRIKLEEEARSSFQKKSNDPR